MNFSTKPVDYQYWIGDKSELPNSKGNLFPFLQDLCRTDRDLVPEVVQRYFFNALGASKEECSLLFEAIKTGWGVIAPTPEGDMLTHIFSGIKLALETGAAVKLIYNQVYVGFVLYGDGYDLFYRGELIAPSAFQEVQDQFDNASPHVDSLLKITHLMSYPDDMARQADLVNLNSTYALMKAIQRIGYNANDANLIRQYAVHLVFPTSVYLPISAHNVARVLQTMCGPESEDAKFPLHPTMLLESDRRKRLWSAFGANAPTFLIPGGRSMSLLSNTFSYEIKQKGNRTGEKRAVTKMYVQTVPLDQAVKDLDTVITTKDVHSPIGTTLARRASSVSLMREFDGEGGLAVLSALKRACGVVMAVADSGSKKRKAENQDEGGGKRKHVDANTAF